MLIFNQTVFVLESWGFVCLFCCWIGRDLSVSDITLYHKPDFQVFLQLGIFLFSFCRWFPLLCRRFLVWHRPTYLFFLLLPLILKSDWKKSSLRSFSRSWLSLFSSRSFMVSGLTFKYSVNFALNIMYGVRQWFSFILLNVIAQFFQNNLLKILSFSHCIFLTPLS